MTKTHEQLAEETANRFYNQEDLPTRALLKSFVLESINQAVNAKEQHKCEWNRRAVGLGFDTGCGKLAIMRQMDFAFCSFCGHKIHVIDN